MKVSGTTWFEEAQKQYAQKWAREIREYLQNELENRTNKEDDTMKVSYKGITGELTRLERIEVPCICTTAQRYKWELDIWDSERNCKVSFHSVSKKDVKFLGGEVTYG